jgi:hypothetical protein
MGPLAEKIVVASILPPHLRATKIDLSKSPLEDLECWRCNSQVFNNICGALSDDVEEFILDKLEIDAHIIWEILHEEYEKPKWIDQEQTMEKALEESSMPSFNIIEPQVSLPMQGEGQRSEDPVPLQGPVIPVAPTAQTGAGRGTTTC